MDGTPKLPNQLRQQIKHSYSFAIAPATGCFPFSDGRLFGEPWTSQVQ